MGKRKNRVFIVIALIVLAAAGFAGSRLLGGVSVAEGYVHEEENRIIFAKVVIPYADQTRVEVVDNFVETQDSIPVLKSETYNYTGTMDGEKLTLQSQSGRAMEATVSAGELVFQSPFQEGGQVPAKLLASTPVQYQKQLETMTNRINEQAEVKKKEVAEKQAKEKERVEFAKKVEKTDRLAADLVENAQYLTDLQFPDEAAVYQSHVSELQGLLDEIKLYAGQPALQMTEYEVMKETAGAMKVLVDGMSSMNDSIQDKKKRMADITGVLETDLTDIKATWEEIKAKAPKPEVRQKAVDAAVKAAQEAIEQAKKRISSIEAERDTASQKADKLYGEANAFLSKVKPK